MIWIIFNRLVIETLSGADLKIYYILVNVLSLAIYLLTLTVVNWVLSMSAPHVTIGPRSPVL